MDLYTIEGIINKLKENTVTTNIVWQRMSVCIDLYDPENALIRDFVLACEGAEVYDKIYQRSSTLGEIDLKNSFYADYRGGRVFLFYNRLNTSQAMVLLALQGSPNASLYLVSRPVVEDEMIEYPLDIRARIEELFCTVIEQVNSPEEYIDRILCQ